MALYHRTLVSARLPPPTESTAAESPAQAQFYTALPLSPWASVDQGRSEEDAAAGYSSAQHRDTKSLEIWTARVSSRAQVEESGTGESTPLIHLVSPSCSGSLSTRKAAVIFLFGEATKALLARAAVSHSCCSTALTQHSSSLAALLECWLKLASLLGQKQLGFLLDCQKPRADNACLLLHHPLPRKRPIRILTVE